MNSNNNTGSQYEGRVEILHNGTWGTICDHDWEQEDAQVACQSLGFYGAVRAVRNAYYGGGTGRVWLDHVECAGMETSLANCSHFPFGTVDSDCTDHSNDAGVVCFDGRYVCYYLPFGIDTNLLYYLTPGKCSCIMTCFDGMHVCMQLHKGQLHKETIPSKSFYQPFG